MSTDYEKSSFEQKAFTLLSPLSGTCPDSVWDNVSVELAARKAEADNKWFKKAANSPRTALIVAGVIGIITLSSWMLFMNKGDHNTAIANTTVQQAPQPVKQTPVKENTPAPAPVVTNTNNTVAQSPAMGPPPTPVVSQPVAQNPITIHTAVPVGPVTAAPASIINKPIAAPQKPAAAVTNGSPLLGHNDPVFDVSTSPDAAEIKGKQSSDSSATTVHRGISSVQAEIPIMDTAQ